MSPTNTDLRKFIIQTFTDEELDTLVFDYFPEAKPEFGSGMTLIRKAMNLIGYCERRGRSDDLLVALAHERAEPWGQRFGVLPTRKPSFPVETRLLDRRIHEKTGIELIRIPAGPFKYADDYEQQIMFDLPEYWIGRTPVTNAQYKRFIDANPGQQVPFTSNGQDKPYCWDERSRTFPPHKAEHPVVLVSWDDAKAFCDWAGLILPTDEQWVKAARGTTGFRWPWGSESPTPEHANFDGNVGSTTPVGQYSPKGDSPYGCVDMFGNVQEWTMSWHIADRAPILRGISWLSNTTLAKGIAFRSYNDRSTRVRQGGFRVVELLSDPGS